MRRCRIETGVFDVPKQPHGIAPGMRRRWKVIKKNIAYHPPIRKGKNIPPTTAAEIADANSKAPTNLTNLREEGNPNRFQVLLVREGRSILLAPPIASSWQAIKNNPELTSTHLQGEARKDINKPPNGG
ncbi:MAG TPA: hypothetical protein QF431_02590 [Acidimicrobiales bacterium]|jgi:hypothetical protein|nr:hypothetical protein [Acidimicrobiales bacterium]